MVFALLLLPGCTRGGGQASPTTPPPTTATSSPASGDELLRFRTPTDNIGCAVTGEGVGCQVASAAWTLPPKPADCDADWGAGVRLDAKGTVEIGGCYSDSLHGAERVVDYGTSISAGPFRCSSATDGLTCVRTDSGEGFFVSRAAYRVLGSSFVSPTGNLACELGLEYVECAVKERTWHAPEGKGDCGTEYGGVEFFDGGPGFTCLDAAHFDQDQVLPYGGTITSEGKTCTLEREGVTCRVGTKGRGFFLSRTSYRFL